MRILHFLIFMCRKNLWRHLSLQSYVIRQLETETMYGKNQPLVTDEPVEVQDVKKITHLERKLWNTPQI